MEKNKILKVLIPVVAVVIIIESLLLVDGMVKKKNGSNVTETKQGDILNPAFELAFKVDKSSLKTGEMGKVAVLAKSKGNWPIDNVNLYVKYDPAMVTVTNLVFDSKLPKPTYQKISEKRGMVVVNYYIVDLPEGYKVKNGDSLSLVTFDIQPKSLGKLDFEISTGNEMNESATMFVENTSGDALPFSSSKLSINVVE